MENILYLDDYINLYNKNINKLFVYTTYKKTLRYGHIINRKKFLKKMTKLLDENNLNKSIFNNEITFVTNSSYYEEDKILIKEVLEELNYKKINFISESNYLKVRNNYLIINCNFSYIYFYYLNDFGNIEMRIYSLDNIINKLIIDIIKIINKKNIFLYGKNVKQIENLLKDENIDYYYYEEYENLIIKLLIENKKV